MAARKPHAVRDHREQGRWRSLGAAAALAVIAALPVLLYLPFMDEPLYVDEGVYGSIARGLLDGQIPYRDLFDNKPPLHYLWYALSFGLFGDTAVAPRLLAALALSGTTLLVFAQARLMLSRPAAAYVAATAFALATGISSLNANATSEAYMLLPMTGSLVAFTIAMRGGRARWFVLAGVLGGVAVLSKPLALWSLLTLGGAAIVWGRAHARGLRSAMLVAGGAAAVGGLVALPFALTGTFDELFDANVRFNLELGADLPLWVRLSEFLQRSLFHFPLAAAPLVIAGAYGAITLIRRRPWQHQHLLLPWLIASALGVASSGFFFLHYFMIPLPALALLGGVAFDAFPRTHATARRRRAAWAGAAAFVLAGLIAVGLNIPSYAAATPADRHLVRGGSAPRAVRENASIEIGRYLAEVTRPGDTIYVHGAESSIYFYAGRLPAARYFYDLAILVRGGEGSVLDVASDIRERLPAYVVDSTGRAEGTEWETVGQPDFWASIDLHPPEFEAVLEERYEHVGRLLFAELYRLKDGGLVRGDAPGLALDGGPGRVRGER